MICLATFKQILEHLEDKDHKIDAFSEVFGTSEKVLDLLDHDEVVELLEDVFDDKEEIIPRWIWELNYGHDWKPGYATDVDGNDIKLETAEDLYNYLVNTDTEALKDTVIFACGPAKGQSDFELTYHPVTNDYSFSLETDIHMDQADTLCYLTDIASNFAEWMVEENRDIDWRLDLGSIFTDGMSANSHFKSIEEAYAAFRMLVDGAIEQGVESKWYDEK